MDTILIAGAGLVGLILIFSCIQFLRKRMAAKRAKKRADHLESIRPAFDFFVRENGSCRSDPAAICLTNTGSGPALDVVIEDVCHPEEPQWCFRFGSIDRIEPGQTVSVDFDFFAGGYKAANKYDQLSVFDPGRANDLATRITIHCRDSEATPRSQHITIGRDNPDSPARKQRLKLIAAAMTRKSR